MVSRSLENYTTCPWWTKTLTSHGQFTQHILFCYRYELEINLNFIQNACTFVLNSGIFPLKSWFLYRLYSIRTSRFAIKHVPSFNSTKFTWNCSCGNLVHTRTNIKIIALFLQLFVLKWWLFTWGSWWIGELRSESLGILPTSIVLCEDRF